MTVDYLEKVLEQLARKENSTFGDVYALQTYVSCYLV